MSRFRARHIIVLTTSESQADTLFHIVEQSNERSRHRRNRGVKLK
jgi:hypothetical protein